MFRFKCFFSHLNPKQNKQIQLRPTVENGSKNSILSKGIYEDGRGGGKNICPLPLIIESRKKSSSLEYYLRPPDFHWGPHILIGDPIFSLGPQDFRWRPPYYHLRLQHFYWRPHIFIGEPIFSLENPRFSLETLFFHWRP